jgi:hypothetical protein
LLFSMDVIITDYLRYRAKQREFRLDIIEDVIRNTKERYIDMATGRKVAVGRHEDKLVMIPYEIKNNLIIPVTIHATTRQQIKFRIKIGRFVYE